MSMGINEDILMAYVDGQLDAREVARVEKALSGDPEARASVRALREGAMLLRASFNEPLNEPVPARVLEAIDAAMAESAAPPGDVTPAPGTRTFAPWPVAIAASIAVLAIALGGVNFLANQRVEQQIALLRAAAESDREARERVLSQALEKLASGETASWENPDSGRRGSITPVRTFKSRDGQWCREYAADEWLGGKRELRRAIACREGEGLWRTRLVLIDDT